MSTNREYWNRAKKVIPGGSQLLSKRADMFHPEAWPAYFKKASGIKVWDLEDNCYVDMSLMGVGTCVLGYAQPEVGQAVIEKIQLGSMSTLNCPEEVELAEKLISLHPGMESVRFSRSGGEACAIAIRIARAATEKNKVVFCGYHGWHDWYIASNLSDKKNLDAQLLPGLNPKGVPDELRGTSVPFQYGDLKSFHQAVNVTRGDLAAVIMEVQRDKPVDLDFLRGVQKICREKNIVLIFDEITSGFRFRAGASYPLHGLDPDIVVLGKGLGNGFPIAAVLGKNAVMDAVQESFISSTYWSEGIGFTAALKTIEVYETNQVEKHLLSLGEYLRGRLTALFERHRISVEVLGMPAVLVLSIKEKDPLIYKTALTQEMLKHHFLASTTIFLSWAHTQESIDAYLKALDSVLEKISKSKEKGALSDLLEGSVCSSGFTRLN